MLTKANASGMRANWDLEPICINTQFVGQW